MQLNDVVQHQPEHSAVLYERGDLTLQRTVVVEEAALEQAFEQVPWANLIFLRCDRQQGGKRILSYRWRADQTGWGPAA